MVTNLRQRYYVAIYLVRSKPMPCHHAIIVMDTTGTTYTLYEIEKQKETIKEKTKTKNPNRIRKRKTNKSQNQKKQSVVPPPAQAKWPTLRRGRAGKKKKQRTVDG